MKIREPREGEIIGEVIEKLGGNRVSVECRDGYERICRIPGKLKKRIWVKPDDIVVIKPWEGEYEKKGDVVWRYNKNQIGYLKKKGFL